MKKFEKVLFKTMLVMIPLTVFVLAYAWSINALANQIYKATTEQFLK